MTKKEILEGLEFRIRNLSKAARVLEQAGAAPLSLEDYNSRLDELLGFREWAFPDKKKSLE